MRRVSIKLAIMAAALLGLSFWSVPVELKGIAGYEPLHTFFETVAIVVAMLIYAIIWNSPQSKLAWSRVFLACAFAGVALLDFSHMLSLKGMPVYITPGDPEKAINFWLAARALAAITLFIITITPLTKLKSTYTKYWMMAGILTLVIFTHWIFLFHPELAPRTFIKGQGLTDFKVAAEYILIALNLAAGFALLLRMRTPLAFNAASLFAAVMAMAMGEFLFTLYADVTDIYLVMGHIFKIFAYLFLYEAVFVETIQKPYQEIHDLHKATQEQSNFIRIIADNTPGMLAYWDKNLICTFANQHYLDWFGRTDEQMHGIHIQDLMGEELFHKNEPFIRAALGGESQHFERKLVKPNGEAGYTWAQYTPHKIDGKVAGFLALITDISSLRKEQEAVHENEQRFRTLLTAIPQQVWTATPDGTFDYVNEKITSYFGLTSEQAIKQGWATFVYPDDLSETAKHWQHALVTGEPFEFEFRLVRAADDMPRWHLAMALPLKDQNGIITKWYGTNTDITERKQAEHDSQVLHDQMGQTAKMEAVGHLTAGIAHDFNNMLGAIMGYAELSKQVITAGKPDSVQRYLDEVVKASHRAKELILQMLTFSRLSPDLQGQEIPVTLLAPVVKEVTSLLRSSIPSTINLNYLVDDEDLKARIQPINLHQIILNLGINARDANGEYGNIDISLSKYSSNESVCDSCQENFTGEFVKLTVRDTGSGIEPHILHNIFNPFFTTKGVGKGTGMGLSVVHGLVHSLGGHILVESVLGKGTAFSVLLPVSQREVVKETHTVQPSGASNSLQGIRIMVVDDELYMTAMLHDFLGEHGAEMTTFNSPLAALSFFEKNPQAMDIVITDETMPDLSGLHMAEQMLKLRPTLPIILCTGFSEHATPALAKKAGLAGFLSKPVEMDALVLQIRKLIKA